MQTLMLMFAGVLMAVGTVFRLPPVHRSKGAMVFSVVWLLAVLWNLRSGLSQGHSLGEEAPTHLLIYLVPVVLAWSLVRLLRLR